MPKIYTKDTEFKFTKEFIAGRERNCTVRIVTKTFKLLGVHLIHTHREYVYIEGVILA